MKFFLAASCPCCDKFSVRFAEAEIPPTDSTKWTDGDKSFDTERDLLAEIGIAESLVERKTCRCGKMMILTNFPTGELLCQECSK
jgi:hypothetical protein